MDEPIDSNKDSGNAIKTMATISNLRGAFM
jgi:hypothetical protein